MSFEVWTNENGVLLGDQEARKLFHIRRIEIEKSVPGEWVQL
jgi:hypothetical protein